MDNYTFDLLFDFARNGSVDEFQQLSAENCGFLDIDVVDSFGWSLLTYACHHNHFEMANALLDHKLMQSDAIDGPNKAYAFRDFVEFKIGYNGSTALHVSAFAGHDEIVHLLLSKGKANANALDNDSRTPAHCALLGNQHSTIHMLINFGADASLCDVFGNSLAHFIAPLPPASACCHPIVDEDFSNACLAELEPSAMSNHSIHSADLDFLVMGSVDEAINSSNSPSKIVHAVISSVLSGSSACNSELSPLTSNTILTDHILVKESNRSVLSNAGEFSLTAQNKKLKAEVVDLKNKLQAARKKQSEKENLLTAQAKFYEKEKKKLLNKIQQLTLKNKTVTQTAADAVADDEKTREKNNGQYNTKKSKPKKSGKHRFSRVAVKQRSNSHRNQYLLRNDFRWSRK